jgi:hypothetical protein
LVRMMLLWPIESKGLQHLMKLMPAAASGCIVWVQATLCTPANNTQLLQQPQACPCSHPRMLDVEHPTNLRAGVWLTSHFFTY